LVYNTSADYPPPPVLYNLGNNDFFDDINYVPLDKEPLLGPVDRQLVIDMSMENITGISRYVPPYFAYHSVSETDSELKVYLEWTYIHWCQGAYSLLIAHCQ